jgi:hypothetical protein
VEALTAATTTTTKLTSAKTATMFFYKIVLLYPLLSRPPVLGNSINNKGVDYTV